MMRIRTLLTGIALTFAAVVTGCNDVDDSALGDSTENLENQTITDEGADAGRDRSADGGRTRGPKADAGADAGSDEDVDSDEAADEALDDDDGSASPSTKRDGGCRRGARRGRSQRPDLSNLGDEIGAALDGGVGIPRIGDSRRRQH